MERKGKGKKTKGGARRNDKQQQQLMETGDWRERREPFDGRQANPLLCCWLLLSSQ